MIERIRAPISVSQSVSNYVPVLHEIFVENRLFEHTPPLFGASVGGDLVGISPRSLALSQHCIDAYTRRHLRSAKVVPEAKSAVTMFIGKVLFSNYFLDTEAIKTFLRFLYVM